MRDDLPIISRSVAKTMTGIEWADFSGNPWTGCSEIPASTGGRSGCNICYAREFAANRLKLPWGPNTPRHRFAGFDIRMRRLDRIAADTGLPLSVFSMSLGDFLDAEVPAEWRAEFIETVEACRNLTWLLLTHRPHLARKFLPVSWRSSPPANVWPGVTIDHPNHGFRWKQHSEFWGHTGRAWVSAEPLAASLATIDLSDAVVTIYGGASGVTDPTWEFNPDWVRESIDRYGLERTYFKQFGDFHNGQRVGKKKAGRDLDGLILDHTPWPLHRELLYAVEQKKARATIHA